MKFQDITGLKFNRLLVIKRAEDKDNHPAWLCRCDCGNETVVSGKYLKNGKIKSCGCYRKESLKQKMIELNKRFDRRVHGQSKSRLYRIWCGMRQRCSDSKMKDYGGRGITVCPEWENSFEKFRDWSMNNGYTEFLTIDRIDVNRGYFPENCRWVNFDVQNKNKRNNIKIAVNGEIKCVSEWCEIYGISQSLVHQRVHKLNWDYEKAIKTPIKKQLTITINGVTKTEEEWCKEKGMSRRLFRYRRKTLNLSPEEAILRPVNRNRQHKSCFNEKKSMEHIK